MSTFPGPAPHVHAEQEPLPGMGPRVGERYRSTASGAICAVIDVDQRRYCWITVRMHGGEQTIRLDRFLRAFKRI